MNPGFLDDAVALAGALAEAGVQRIEIREPGGPWSELSARVTDLPGLLQRSGDGAEIRWSGGGARIERGHLSRWGEPVPRRPGV